MARTTPELAAHSPDFRATLTGGHMDPMDVTCTGPAYTTVLLWNRVSNQEPSCPEAETLPLDNRRLHCMLE
ncbi:hypothetical protein AVEN_208124-1 [Araneus ventricosus]|uniref:Uncharacterized protein n=1 Tax=Araneus ventricosus TaxID=182803 RepID=A0A4Y2I1V8_ARAVE|nr:hypothetical protein AVEN_208124-1 [Araneus ventricosus]